MANPQPTDAHLRIAHSIQEEIMMRDFTKRQRAILDLVLRLSWGCGKKVAVIPKQRDFELVGVSENKIKSELEWLCNARVITWAKQTNEYEFNKNYDEWKISIVPKYNRDRFNELLSMNIRTSQNGKLFDETATSQNGKKLDEKGRNFPPRGEVDFVPEPTGERDTRVPKESIKESIIEEEDARAREGKIFQFFNQNIGLITPFQAQVISQYLDSGIKAEMIVEVLQDSLGKSDRWSWSNTVLKNSLSQNVKTLEQYKAKKVERKNSRSRDKPIANMRNFTERKFNETEFDNFYEDV